MTYYAFQYSHIVGQSPSGTPEGRLHTFESKELRDTWVERGPSRRHEACLRDAVIAPHEAVQRFERGDDLERVHHTAGGEEVFYDSDGAETARYEDVDQMPMLYC